MKYLLFLLLSLIPLTSASESKTEVTLNLGIINGGGSDGEVGFVVSKSSPSARYVSDLKSGCTISYGVSLPVPITM